MRFFEFVILESTKSDLNALAQTAKDLPDADPKKSKILDFIKRVIASVTGRTQEAVYETTDAEIDAVMTQLAGISDLKLEDPKIAGAVKNVMAQFGKQQRKAGEDKIKQQINKFLQEYSVAIDGLSTKIQDNAAVIKKYYDIEIAKGRLNSTERRSLIRKENAKKALDGTIGAVFTQSIMNPDNPLLLDNKKKTQLVKFLKQSKQGIVPFSKMIEQGQGNIAEMIDPIYKPIFDEFKEKLFRAQPPAQAGNWGPGEIGLIVLGNPLKKPDGSGDLETAGGVKFELKASREHTKGGRLSPPDANTGKLTTKWQSVLNQYFKGLPVQDYQYKDTKRKIGNLNFYPGAMPYINELIQKQQARTKTKFKTKKFVKDAIQLTLDNPITKEEETNFISPMVDAKNLINYDVFKVQFSKLLFFRYKTQGSQEKFSAILVFNPDKLNYTVIKSADDIEQQEKDKIITITGGIDFDGTQVTKSPQIGIA
jgi:uncharacterized protein YpuA (DUF1002 family)